MFYIVAISVACLIGMAIASRIFKKKGDISSHPNIKYSIIITLLISSVLYFNFLSKIYYGLFQRGEIRMGIVNKVDKSELMFGLKLDSLNVDEYTEIRKHHNVPELPSTAYNISYQHDHEIFLPDFGLTITHEIPLNEKVSEFKNTRGQYSETRTIEKFRDRQKVTF